MASVKTILEQRSVLYLILMHLQVDFHHPPITPIGPVPTWYVFNYRLPAVLLSQHILYKRL